MRTRRWTPCSERSRPYARGPRTMKVALFRPASSPRDSSMISVSKRCRSAHLRYMRISISTQSWASIPPWPTEMVTTALWLAYGSVNSKSSSCERSSLARAERSSTTCFSSSWSVSASFSRSTSSRARRSSRAHVATRSRCSLASRAFWLARRGSSQAPGFVSSASSSSARFALTDRSKVLLELQDPVQKLPRVQVSVHSDLQWLHTGRRVQSPAVAPLVFLARTAPARVVAAEFSGLAGRHCRGLAERSRSPLLSLDASVGAGGSIQLARTALGDLAHERRWRGCRGVALHLDPIDRHHDVALDPLAELVEHLESLVLVLDQRVALPVRAQPDALAEVLHLGQVLHPLPVDRAQHHVALDHRHEVGADLLDLAVVRL